MKRKHGDDGNPIHKQPPVKHEKIYKAMDTRSLEGQTLNASGQFRLGTNILMSYQVTKDEYAPENCVYITIDYLSGGRREIYIDYLLHSEIDSDVLNELKAELKLNVINDNDLLDILTFAFPLDWKEIGK